MQSNNTIIVICSPIRWLDFLNVGLRLWMMMRLFLNSGGLGSWLSFLLFRVLVHIEFAPFQQ